MPFAPDSVSEEKGREGEKKERGEREITEFAHQERRKVVDYKVKSFLVVGKLFALLRVLEAAYLTLLCF
jgi:hypothetical protein